MGLVIGGFFGVLFGIVALIGGVIGAFFIRGRKEKV